MSAQDERHPIEQLAEEYVARRRRGERPTIEDYAAAHPEHADEIRELFPAIAAVEGLKDDTEIEGPQHDAEPIEQLGDYRIVGEIGRGGMGVVYEAEQVTLGRRVAVKVLPRFALDDPTRLARFEREARTAAGLHHTNIVPIFGTGESDGHHFFVMQLIRGLGLDRVLAALRGEKRPPRTSTTDSMLDSVVSRLRRGDLSDPTELDIEHVAAGPAPDAVPVSAEPPRERSYYRNVAKIAAQVSDALAHAHAHKTLHRDIKPANILLDEEGTAWITDFGLAKALEQADLTRSSDVVGTLRYMAPEQLAGDFDERTDIYSLGLTLWELLALRPAYSEQDRAALLGAIREGRVPRLRRINHAIPRDLATIVEKACAAEPRDRYRSADELAADLGRFLEDRPIRARHVSALEAGWRWCRRNRATAALAAVALVAVLAAAAIGWTGWVVTRDALASEELRTKEARAAQELASANLVLTLRAFETVFDEISGPDPFVTASSTSDGDSAVITPTPVSPAEVALLEHVLDFYRRFAERNEGNAELAREAAIAHRRVGDIQQRLGRFADAESAYRQAVRLWSSTSAEEPLELAVAQSQLGRVLLAGARFDEALECHQAALEALGPDAGTPATALERARTHNQIGVAIDLAERGPGPGGPGRPRTIRPEQFMDTARRVMPHHEAALQILGELLAASPSNPELKLELARTRRLLARAPRGRPGARDPEAELEEATRILTELVDEFPAAAHFRFELAETLLAGADRPRPGERPPVFDDGRRARLEQATTILEHLAEEQPEIPAYRSSLAKALHEIGMDSWRRGNQSSTEESLGRALALWSEILIEQPDVPRHVHEWGKAARSLHELLMSRGRLEESRDLAQACLEEAELLPVDRDTDRVVAQLWLSYARSLDGLGDGAAAQEARDKGFRLMRR